MILAILRAQWLSMRFGTRGRFIGILIAAFWYGLWALAAFALYNALAESSQAELNVNFPLVMAAVFAYWQLMPIASASMGSSLDLRKLLAYPIPHAKLFAVEVLLRLTTGVEMLILLAAAVLGLAANPHATAWGAFVVLPVFVLFNLLVASGTRSLLERLLTRRKLREVLVLVMAMVWVLPRLLMSMGYQGRGLTKLGVAMQSVAFPWTAAAYGSMGQSFGLALLSLLGWVAVAGLFGRWQFERGLRYDAQAAQATPNRPTSRPRLSERFFRFPSAILPDPLAAIVEKELRSFTRTPRFRTVFIMGFTFGLAVWFPVVASDRAEQRGSWLLTVVCVYALTMLGQVSYWNSFGFDRSAAAFYFAAPPPMAQVIAGKNIAALIFIYLEVAAIITVMSALRLSAGWGQSLETLVVMTVCALYMIALGNLGSVNYPRGLSGEKVGSGGGRGLQGFLFLIYPIALLPVGLAYLARYAFENEVIFGFILAISGLIGGVFYYFALESAVRTATRRREQMIQELSQGDGPVSKE